MNKQNIQRALGEEKKFLTITEIARIMDLDRGTVRQLLKGLQYIPVGKKKLFLTADVAEVLYRRQI